MDPYSTLGVARGCTREQVKEAFRSLVHRAHPDRGGDGEAFVRLCAAYREVLQEVERGEAPDEGVPVMAPSGRGTEVSPDPGPTREDYVAWLRRVSQGSARRRPIPWWRKHPTLAKTSLLGLIGLCGVLVLCAALALGTRMPGQKGGAGRLRNRASVGGPAADRPVPEPSPKKKP
jgi:hypothetical protein